MASNYVFRKSISGFHRDDVMAYIAHINAQHDTQVSQLRADLLSAQASAQEADALRQRIAELEAQLASQEEAPAVAEEVPEAPKPENWVEAELAAYRRAESAERRARERISQMYDLANGLTADASVRLEEANAALEELAKQAEESVAALQAALQQSRGVLREVASGISSLQNQE
jgi:cell division septum initiation protein DivIVA